MTRTKITSDEWDVYVECPHCGNCEDHPIDEQRHHLQHFDIIEWHEDQPDLNEVSDMQCKTCSGTFELEWDYKNKNL